jgi:serum/glucocorticoid-regulated kinase 2
MSDAAKELLRGMLERKVSDRLGSTGPGAIKRAAFFQPISFDRVLQKAYTPEFRPPKAESDSAPVNFDPEFTSERPVDSYVETKMSQTMINKSNFQDFTYRGDSRLKG